MGSPARFSSGLSTSPRGSMMSKVGVIDPSAWHVFFDDFDKFVVGDWTITTTEAGAGSATEALGDADGGVLVVANDAADDDADFFQKVGEGFLIEAGKRAFFKTRLKISDATQSDLVVGLQVTDTTPLDVTDGIYFLKADGSAALSIVCRKNATTGSNSASSIATLVSDTWVTLGWFYDGKGNVTYFIDDVHKGTLDASSSYLPDTELTVSFGIQNGEAVAKILTVDYVMAGKER
jgi:hypothetical protein